MWTRTIVAAIVVLGTGGPLVAHPQRTPSSAAAAAGSGRALFITHCASCHGIAARGDGPVADALRI